MTLGIVQARLGSTRLPGKMLRPLAGRPALEHTLERARAARRIGRLVVATTDLTGDDPLARLAAALGIDVFRGHPDDVLDRYYRAAMAWGAAPDDTIVRLTGDCPLHDPAVIDHVIAEFEQARARGNPRIEYASNISPPTYPSGLDVEAFSFAALEAAWREASRDYQREHVTLYIREHPERFPALNVSCPEGDYSGLRWTLDVEQDARMLDSLLRLVEAPAAAEYSYRAGLRAIEQDSSVAAINASLGRNVPAVEAVFADAMRPWKNRLRARGDEAARRAADMVAGCLPRSPFERPGLAVRHAEGCGVRDLDGNEFVDFQMGGGTIVLGHGGPPSETHAGIGASEIDPGVALAAKLLERFPPMRRAALAPSLADALAIAVSRAVRATGRWRVLHFGSMALEEEIRAAGPAAVSGRDLGRVEFSTERPDGGAVSIGAVADAAAVMIEPVVEAGGTARLTEGVAEICAEMGTLLVVHGTPALIAGGRVDLGESPAGLDLAVILGSAVANGLPIGVTLGAPETFEPAPEDDEPRVLASGMSIAAALATIERLDGTPDRERTANLTAAICDGLRSIASDFRLGEYCEIGVRRPYVIFRFRDGRHFGGGQMQFLFDELMLARGFLWGPVLTVTPAHREAEIGRALEAARSCGRVLRTLIDNRAVERVFEAERKRQGLPALFRAQEKGILGLPQHRERGVIGVPA